MISIAQRISYFLFTKYQTNHTSQVCVNISVLFDKQSFRTGEDHYSAPLLRTIIIVIIFTGGLIINLDIFFNHFGESFLFGTVYLRNEIQSVHKILSSCKTAKLALVILVIGRSIGYKQGCHFMQNVMGRLTAYLPVQRTSSLFK